ncbi:MAG TPA: LCP family protein [Acidimicrobiia bacterium]|nr:LCP family protein [Acidimicrobiia bacterium]
MDWITTHPFKSFLTVVLGIGLGLGLFVFDGFNAFASDPALDTEAAEQALAERSTAEVQSGLRAYLEQQAELLRAQSIADEERRALAAELEAELRQLEFEEVAAPLEIPQAVSPELPDEMFESILLIGTDASGFLADTIINVLVPSDGSAPLMVSIPRDLYLNDACTERYQRINRSMGGCSGVAGGPDLLAINVATFTGIKVDHYARVTFSGFEAVVDRLGGTQLCVGDNPIRDSRSGLNLAAGCQLADGEQTLAWVRSRSPEIFRDGQWVSSPGSDFDRQRKQQEVLFQLANVLSSYDSVGALSAALQNLASVVRMDSGFGVGEAASLGFRYRGLGPSDVIRLSIPVENYRTGAGAQVLIPSQTFNRTLAARYPAAAR